MVSQMCVLISFVLSFYILTIMATLKETKEAIMVCIHQFEVCFLPPS